MDSDSVVPEWHRIEPRVGCICDANNDTINTPRVYDWQDTQAFVICLATRPDRLQCISDQLHRVQLCTQTWFYRPEKPSKATYKAAGFTNPTAYGCWHSHRTIVERAKDFTGPVLVMEDDCWFQPHFTPQELNKVLQFIAKNQDNKLDIFFLGHVPVFGRSTQTIDSSSPEAKQVWQVKSVLTHSYFISRSGRLKLLAKPVEPVKSWPWAFTGQGIDSWYASSMSSYAMKQPSFATQTPTVTSDHHDRSTLTGGFTPFLLRCHHSHTQFSETMVSLTLPFFFVIGLLILWYLFKTLHKRRTKQTSKYLHTIGD